MKLEDREILVTANISSLVAIKKKEFSVYKNHGYPYSILKLRRIFKICQEVFGLNPYYDENNKYLEVEFKSERTNQVSLWYVKAFLTLLDVSSKIQYNTHNINKRLVESETRYSTNRDILYYFCDKLKGNQFYDLLNCITKNNIFYCETRSSILIEIFTDTTESGKMQRIFNSINRQEDLDKIFKFLDSIQDQYPEKLSLKMLNDLKRSLTYEKLIDKR